MWHIFLTIYICDNLPNIDVGHKAETTSELKQVSCISSQGFCGILTTVYASYCIMLMKCTCATS